MHKTKLLAQKVVVKTPATSANLGPGFDTLGLALKIYDTLEVEFYPNNLGEPTLKIGIYGEGETTLAKDETNLVAKSMRTVFDAVNVSQPNIFLQANNVIPQGFGLGSSAAAIVSGMLAANTVLPTSHKLSGSEIFNLACQIEGHPDNVSAALDGNLAISWKNELSKFAFVSVPVLSTIKAAIFVPKTSVNTKTVRNVLPETVTHTQAVNNLARVALLVHGLTVDSDLLFPGTADFLHQNYRKSSMQNSFQLMCLLRNAGYAAAISGAGSAVLVLFTDETVQVKEKGAAEPVGAKFFDFLDSKEVEFGNWSVEIVDISTKGATVVINEQL